MLTEGRSMTTETYAVAGMTCSHCVNALSAEISRLDGIVEVSVDLAAGAVTVVSTEPLSAADVAAAVDEAGYELFS
jgi:copper chaperone CopZ